MAIKNYLNNVFMNLNLKSKTQKVSKRATERVVFNMVVETESKDGVSFTSSGNLNTTGMYIESRVPYLKGTVLKLTFFMPEYNQWMSLKGEVVTTTVSDDGVEMGLGVKFLNLTKEQKQTLDNYIEERIIEQWFCKG